MPQLIKEIDGRWQAVANDDVEWRTAGEWKQGAPLRLSVEDEATLEHGSAARIAIEFPAFNDGRGLSTAVLLRTRFGFTGELRAVGAVHEDILHYMIRCGFTAAEIPDDRDVETALNCLQPYTDFYQQSVKEPRPQFKRVKRG